MASPPVTSILLYGSLTWKLLADSDKRIQAFQNKCLMKLLHIFYFEHKIKTECGARPTSLWTHENLFLQLSRDANLPRHSLLNCTSGRYEGWATPWLAEECCMDIKEWTPLFKPELHTTAFCEIQVSRFKVTLVSRPRNCSVAF